MPENTVRSQLEDLTRDGESLLERVTRYFLPDTDRTAFAYDLQVAVRKPANIVTHTPDVGCITIAVRRTEYDCHRFRETVNLDTNTLRTLRINVLDSESRIQVRIGCSFFHEPSLGQIEQRFTEFAGVGRIAESLRY